MVTTSYPIGPIGSTPVQRSTFLNNTYTQDVYSFSIGSTSSINLDLHNIGVSFADDADLSLYLDANNNGTFEPNYDRFLSSSSNPYNFDESIDYLATSGRYLAVVNRHTGNFNYDLDLSASPQYPSPTTAPNLLPKEDLDSIPPISLGIPSGYNRSRTITQTGWVGSTDTADTYRFTASSMGDGVRISASLAGLSSDADLRLVQDRDRDQIVDPGEILAYSWRSGTSSESLQYSLSNYQLGQGDCFFQVYQYSGNTNYNLSMTFESIFM